MCLSARPEGPSPTGCLSYAQCRCADTSLAFEGMIRGGAHLQGLQQGRGAARHRARGCCCKRLGQNAQRRSRRLGLRRGKQGILVSLLPMPPRRHLGFQLACRITCAQCRCQAVPAERQPSRKTSPGQRRCRVLLQRLTCCSRLCVWKAGEGGSMLSCRPRPDALDGQGARSRGVILRSTWLLTVVASHLQPHDIHDTQSHLQAHCNTMP